MMNAFRYAKSSFLTNCGRDREAVPRDYVKLKVIFENLYKRSFSKKEKRYTYEKNVNSFRFGSRIGNRSCWLQVDPEVLGSFVGCC